MSTIDIRMPWGKISKLGPLFLRKKPFVLLGCLSSEERCIAVPTLLSKNATYDNKGTLLLHVIDPPDSFPDYRKENYAKTTTNEQTLVKNKLPFKKTETDLLADEGELVKLINQFQDDYKSETIVLDISTFPKRYYALFIKRLINRPNIKNIIVTYTQPTPHGYVKSDAHLAEDIMTCANLPGFAPKAGDADWALVISLGFEEFHLKSILKMSENKEICFILNFPPNGEYFRRQWKILRAVMPEVTNNVEIVSALDVERLYLTLDNLNKDSNGLLLAPFGPKTHTLGMVLFAIKHECGLIYSQPKSYSPHYSRGIGESWGYVVKWDGIACYNRNIHKT